MDQQPTHKQLKDWDHRYLWHPFTQMQEWVQEEPLIIERGKGSYLIDTEGKKYLDGTSSIWVNLHGHRHPVLNRAIKQQLDKIAHSTFLGLSNHPVIGSINGRDSLFDSQNERGVKVDPPAASLSPRWR